jgi:hypothetical protein
MQTIDFLSLFVMFNSSFPVAINEFLSRMYVLSQEKLIPNPANNWTLRPDWPAWIFKKKLSQNGVPPFFLGDIGIDFYLLVCVYLIALLLWVFGWRYKKGPRAKSNTF